MKFKYFNQMYDEKSGMNLIFLSLFCDIFDSVESMATRTHRGSDRLSESDIFMNTEVCAGVNSIHWGEFIIVYFRHLE